MENNNEQTNINELIKDIDNKIEEVTSDPSYDEKEGKEQMDAIYDYIKKHPKETEEILKNIKEAAEEE